MTIETAGEMAEEGRKEERARIVAWLRSFEIIRGGTLGPDEDAAHEALLMVVADAIERGDHVRPTRE